MIKIQNTLKLPLLFFFLLLCKFSLAQQDTLSFIHITDLHVIFSQDCYPVDMMEYRKEKQYDQGENRLRQFLQSVPVSTNSDMVIATGDLIDFFEAETGCAKMLDIQIEQFAHLLDDYNLKVFLALGNHDIFSFRWSDNKLKVSQNNSGRARAAWTRLVPCFKNGTYYSKSFQVGSTTYKLIFLDDSFYWLNPGDKSEIPYVEKPQLYWLNAQLQESVNDVEIILMHIPFADSIPQSEYFQGLSSVLTENPSTRLILAGHHHKNIVRSYDSSNGNELIQVQTGALVLSKENWRLIRLTENNILVSVAGKTENEIVIPVK